MSLWLAPLVTTGGAALAGTYIIGPEAGAARADEKGGQLRAAASNVQSAIDFLRKWGFKAEADNVEEWFKNGKIWWDDTADDTTTARLSGIITLDNHALWGGRAGLGQAFNAADSWGYRRIAELAATLAHEKVHAHQSIFRTGIAFGGWMLWSVENEGWTKALDVLDKSIQQMVQELAKAQKAGDNAGIKQLLEQIAAIQQAKQETLRDYDHNFCAYSEIGPSDYAAEVGILSQLGNICRVSLETQSGTLSGAEAKSLARISRQLSQFQKELEAKLAADKQRHPVSDATPPPFESTVTIAKISEPKAGGSLLCVVTNEGKFADLYVNSPLVELEKAGCRVGEQVNVRGSAVLPGTVLASLENIQAPTESPFTDRPPLNPLQSALKNGAVTTRLVGDGVSTSHCQLLVTNTGGEAMRVIVPPYEVFAPDNAEFQTMMTVSGRVLEVAAGATSSADLSTVCLAPKSVKPPPASGVNYSVANDLDPKQYTLVKQIIETSKWLEQDGRYKQAPIPLDRRQHTIAQFAIWQEMGARSARTEDAVTLSTIGSDVLRTAGVKPASLSAGQKKSFNKGVKEIFDAADTTLKLAHCASENPRSCLTNKNTNNQ